MDDVEVRGEELAKLLAEEKRVEEKIRGFRGWASTLSRYLIPYQ